MKVSPVTFYFKLNTKTYRDTKTTRVTVEIFFEKTSGLFFEEK